MQLAKKKRIILRHTRASVSAHRAGLINIYPRQSPRNLIHEDFATSARIAESSCGSAVYTNIRSRRKRRSARNEGSISETRGESNEGVQFHSMEIRHLRVKYTNWFLFVYALGRICIMLLLMEAMVSKVVDARRFCVSRDFLNCRHLNFCLNWTNVVWFFNKTIHLIRNKKNIRYYLLAQAFLAIHS